MHRDAREERPGRAGRRDDVRRPGKGSAIAYDLIRAKVPKLVDDRVLYPDIETVRYLSENCTILDGVEAELGLLTLAPDTDLPKPSVPA